MIEMAQQLINEAVEKDSLILSLQSQIEEMSYQIQDLTNQLSERNDQ